MHGTGICLLRLTGKFPLPGFYFVLQLLPSESNCYNLIADVCAEAGREGNDAGGKVKKVAERGQRERRAGEVGL